MNNTTQKRILIIASALFIISALFGIRYGLPFHLVGDEETLINGSLQLLEQRTLFPVTQLETFRFLYYPVLIPYSILLFVVPFALGVLTLAPSVSSLTEVGQYMLVNLDMVWVLARIPSLIAGTLLIYLVYKLAKAMFPDKKQVAFFAALFLITSFFHFQLSIVARHWIWSTLILVLGLWLLFAHKLTSNKDGIKLGVVAALATGISQIGFITAFFIGLAYVLLNKGKKLWGLAHKPFWVFVLIAVLGGAAFVGLNPAAFDFIVAGEETTHIATKSLGFYAEEFSNTLNYLGHKETILSIIALFGLILLYQSRERVTLVIILGIFFLHNLFLFTFFHNAPRYQFYVVPLFAIAAGYALSRLHELLEKLSPRWLRTVFISIIFIIPALGIVSYSALLYQNTTEQELVKWMSEQPKETVYIIDSRNIDFLQTDRFVGLQEEMGRARAANRALIGVDVSVYGGEKIHYTNIHFWNSENKNQDELEVLVAEYDPEYYIISFDSARELEKTSHQILGSASAFEFALTNWGQDIYGPAVEPVHDFGLLNQELFSLSRFGQHIYVFNFQNSN